METIATDATEEVRAPSHGARSDASQPRGTDWPAAEMGAPSGFDESPSCPSLASAMASSRHDLVRQRREQAEEARKQALLQKQQQKQQQQQQQQQQARELVAPPLDEEAGWEAASTRHDAVRQRRQQAEEAKRQAKKDAKKAKKSAKKVARWRVRLLFCICPPGTQYSLGMFCTYEGTLMRCGAHLALTVFCLQAAAIAKSTD